MSLERDGSGEVVRLSLENEWKEDFELTPSLILQVGLGYFV